MIKKVIVIFMTILGLWVFMPATQIAYADPMDPLNGVELAGDESSAVGEVIEPNAPAGVGGNETSNAGDEGLSQEDWEEEERNRKSVQLMDTVMLVAGVAGVILPTLYMGIYLGARIFPPFFLPIFKFITRGKVLPEDIPVYIMFLRTLPVAILGMLLATGWLRGIFAYVWNFVSRNFMK